MNPDRIVGRWLRALDSHVATARMASRMRSQEVQLAEFAALRGEIANRTAQQHVLLGLVITASVALGGVALTTENENLLLLAPPVAMVAGGMWIDHAFHIAWIGAWIGQMRPLQPGWEGSVNTVPLRFASPVFGIIVPFAAPWLGAPVAYLCRAADASHVLTWVAGVEALSIVLALAAVYLFQRLSKEGERLSRRASKVRTR